MKLPYVAGDIVLIKDGDNYNRARVAAVGEFVTAFQDQVKMKAITIPHDVVMDHIRFPEDEEEIEEEEDDD